MCGICDITNISQEPIDLLTDEEIDRIIMGIFLGVITTQSLDLNVYLKTARKLTDGVFKGFGKTIDDTLHNTEDNLMLKDLRENVYVFSGAKEYQVVREVSSFLTTEGKINSFADFKKLAKDKLNEYYENYLKAEYNSAIAQSAAASHWIDIEKDKEYLPMLTYHTVGDGRVRPTHEALNNISRGVDDNFWNTYYPPNGWNCRCTILQSSDAEKTSLKGFKTPDDVPDIFKFNAGKERIVFSPKHPYFKVEPKDVNFAKQNFNLPLP